MFGQKLFSFFLLYFVLGIIFIILSDYYLTAAWFLTVVSVPVYLKAGFMLSFYRRVERKFKFNPCNSRKNTLEEEKNKKGIMHNMEVSFIQLSSCLNEFSEIQGKL